MSWTGQRAADGCIFLLGSSPVLHCLYARRIIGNSCAPQGLLFPEAAKRLYAGFSVSRLGSAVRFAPALPPGGSPSLPPNLTESYGYDYNGNLTTKRDRNLQTINYAYDAANRLTSKTYPDTTSISYTYDLANHLTQVVDPTGTYGFTFDADGRLTQTSTAYSFIAGRTFTVGYGYDAAANRTSMTDPQNAGTTYVYDTLNRLQTLTSPQGAFGFSYDPLSRRTQLTRPNNVTTTYGYDPLSRLLSVLHKLGTTTLDGASYTVDAAGNRLSRTPLPSGTATNFAYDAIYELLTATQGSTTKESYSYDAVGNRLSALNSSGWSYNTSNELTSRPGVTYTYDNNGNTLTKTDSTGTTIYAWDFENRLTSVTLPGSGGNVSFKYDPFGRRIYKSSSSGTSIYAHDGDNFIEETNSTGAVVARYEQGLNIDEPLAMLRSGATSFYHADGLGTVTSLTSPSGSIANTYTFDTFGNLAGSTGSVVNPFRYTGREFDTETSMYYYRARYYDPAIGRFMSEDPIDFLGGSNFYRYANNGPAVIADPTGLWPWPSGANASQVSDLWDWVKGGNRPNSHTDDAVTSDLARTPVMDQIRKRYKDKGCNYSGFVCGDFQYRQLITTFNFVGQTIGSFCAKIHPIRGGMIQIDAQNTWGIASGTRFPALPFGPSNRQNGSLIDMLRGDAPWAYPSGFFNDKAGGVMGTKTYYYHWKEKSPCCQN